MSTDIYTLIWHIVYVLIMIPVVIGNGLIIISVIKFKRLRTTMHILIANLAISDLLVGAVLIPYSLFTDGGALNENMYLCFIKLSLFVICLGSSCYNLMLISFERFLSITRPFSFKKYFTVGKLTIMITCGWFMSLFNGSIPFFGWNKYGVNNTDCVSDTLWHPAYKIMTNWELILALIMNFIMYTVVIRIALRKARARANRNSSLAVHARTDKDVNQTVTMVIVLGMFAMCWFPYVCAAVVVTFYDTGYTQFVRRCTLVPGLLNSAINWVIFGYRNNDFRKAFRYLLTCMCLFRRKRRPQVFAVNLRRSCI